MGLEKQGEFSAVLREWVAYRSAFITVEMALWTYGRENVVYTRTRISDAVVPAHRFLSGCGVVVFLVEKRIRDCAYQSSGQEGAYTNMHVHAMYVETY